MDNRPVGFFDSGFGGLTAVREFRRLFPRENIVFFGDNGRAPYGEKDSSTLRTYASQILHFLTDSGVKAVLAACGTCSLVAGDLIRECGLPACDVVSPSVTELASRDDPAPLAIIATSASIRSGGFERALRHAGITREILSIPCPVFVPLIEAGLAPSDQRVKEAVERYLAPVREAGATDLLLGCTHYGIIEEAIQEYLGEDVRIESASSCGARAMAHLLEERALTGGTGESSFFTSGDPDVFRRTGSLILGEDTGPVCTIPIGEEKP